MHLTPAPSFRTPSGRVYGKWRRSRRACYLQGMHCHRRAVGMRQPRLLTVRGWLDRRLDPLPGDSTGHIRGTRVLRWDAVPLTSAEQPACLNLVLVGGS